MASTNYLFNELIPFPNAAGAAVGVTANKAKGVLLTNTTANGLTAGLITYQANGRTAETRVTVGGNKTQMFPIRVWGVSFESGLTGGFIS